MENLKEQKNILEVGQVYRSTEAGLTKPVVAKTLKIVEGPIFKKESKRNEYRCKVRFTKAFIYKGEVQKYIQYFYYWLAEDYLLNELNGGRMILQEKKVKNNDKKAN